VIVNIGYSENYLYNIKQPFFLLGATGGHKTARIASSNTFLRPVNKVVGVG
jgi:hypothetical protein